MSPSRKEVYVEITFCADKPRQTVMDLATYLHLTADDLANTVIRFYWRDAVGEKQYITDLEQLAVWFAESPKPRVLH